MDPFVFLSFLLSQMVKKLSIMQENPVQPLGQKIHCKRSPGIPTPVLSWRIPWPEEPGGLQSTGWKKSDTTEQLRHRHRGSVCLFYFPEPLRIFFSKLVFHSYFSHMQMQGDFIWTVKMWVLSFTNCALDLQLLSSALAFCTCHITTYCANEETPWQKSYIITRWCLPLFSFRLWNDV